MHITGRRPGTRQGPANFTGTVRLDGTAAPSAPSRPRMFNVHFAPGARTAWHRHGATPRTFMTRLATVEAAEDGTTTEWHPHVDDHPA
ncbi:hypothetical protein ACFYZB_01000 [Streptomyces sp. NPDC001852]|uniref:hypothetical protein n=1 Tax=Streptomyces sp. NPDC001852 TaxID=3364619 RepID=UPI0036C9784D